MYKETVHRYIWRKDSLHTLLIEIAFALRLSHSHNRKALSTFHPIQSSTSIQQYKLYKSPLAVIKLFPSFVLLSC